jgi:hypothetical protein
MTTSSLKTERETAFNPPASNLLPYDSWLTGIKKTPATGWRWRKRGWIETVNICGRLYISRAAIAEFERRAAAGEFSQAHKAPSREKMLA